MFISHLNILSHCIYSPTFSHYAFESLTMYVLLKVTFLDCKRILRCNQFAKCGFD
ncbi:MAG: membrane protein insertion efficiency factor YidD, partial [Lacrimispora sphenoides]